MKIKNLILAAAACILAVAASSCKGRYADNTPNGEVVTVDVKENTDTNGMLQDQPVVTEVTIDNPYKNAK